MELGLTGGFRSISGLWVKQPQHADQESHTHNTSTLANTSAEGFRGWLRWRVNRSWMQTLVKGCCRAETATRADCALKANVCLTLALSEARQDLGPWARGQLILHCPSHKQHWTAWCLCQNHMFAAWPLPSNNPCTLFPLPVTITPLHPLPRSLPPPPPYLLHGHTLLLQFILQCLCLSRARTVPLKTLQAALKDH